MQPAASSRGTLIVLIGPKGSGKTYLGESMERFLGVPFLHVEDIWRALRAEGGGLTAKDFEREGHRRMEAEIERRLAKGGGLCVESTGESKWFGHFLANLHARYRLKLVKISAPTRIRCRRLKAQGNAMSPVRERIVPLADPRLEALGIEFDANIDNRNDLSPKEMAALVAPILAPRAD